jgi:hypothetical protein
MYTYSDLTRAIAILDEIVHDALLAETHGRFDLADALEIEAEATTAGGTYPDYTDVNTVNQGRGDTTLSSYTKNGTDTRFCFVGRHTQLGDVNHVAYDSGEGGVLPFSEAGYTCSGGTATAVTTP